MVENMEGKIKQITIHRISCQVCGEMFCAGTQKEAIRKHTVHVDGKCKILNFWQSTNKILGRELTYSEVIKLMGLK